MKIEKESEILDSLGANDKKKNIEALYNKKLYLIKASSYSLIERECLKNSPSIYVLQFLLDNKCNINQYSSNPPLFRSANNKSLVIIFKKKNYFI